MHVIRKDQFMMESRGTMSFADQFYAMVRQVRPAKENNPQATLLALQFAPRQSR